MHPVLIRVGPLTIHTYGLFLALGFVAALIFCRWQGRKAGLDTERMVDMLFFVAIAAIVGSRLLFVWIERDHYFSHPAEIVMIWKGGLVFLGGVALAVPTGLFFARRYGLPLWETADITAPAISLAHAFGRLGCFFAGCCYGEACSLPWAVTFSHPETLAPRGVPLHPTQLYEALGETLIFSILFLTLRRKKFDGQVFMLYGFLYPVLRFTVEYFRGDEVRGFVGGTMMSTSQLGSILMAALALGGWVFLRRRGKTPAQRKEA